jgi:hypothetical protein
MIVIGCFFLEGIEMPLKLTGIVVILSFLMTGCGLSSQYQSVSDLPRPTQEIQYMDDATQGPVSTPYPQILPSLNPTYLAFATHIMVVTLANDDGSDRSTVTTQQIMDWVDEANLIFSQASLRFLFDPAIDSMEYDSSLLNHVTGTSDPNWTQAVAEGRKVAEAGANKITVIFRNSPIDGDIGSWEEDFILMPSNAPEVCGKPDKSLLAHQIGHYMGLKNTFPQLFNDIKTAESAYEKSGYISTFFDGDGLTDTPPDAYVNQPEYRCGDKTSIKISNAEFSLTRGNLMSYYEPRSLLSPQQIIRIRFIAALRSRNGSLIPSNQDAVSPIQFEDLKLSERFYCDPKIKDMSSYLKHGWNGGSYLDIPSAYGSICTFAFSIAKTGSYEMTLYATKMPEYGVVEISLDDWLLNDGIDLYSMYPLPTGPVSFGTLYLEAGDHTLEFKVIRKSVDSLNYNFGLDALTIQPKEQ